MVNPKHHASLRRSLTGSLGRSKYAFHKLQNGLLGGAFLTTQGPAATKNVLKGQINWDCHWKLVEKGFDRYLNKIKNWKNQVSGFSSTQKGREKRRVKLTTPPCGRLDLEIKCNKNQLWNYPLDDVTHYIYISHKGKSKAIKQQLKEWKHKTLRWLRSKRRENMDMSE